MLALTLSAELNGVTDLKPTDTPESPYFYTFKVQCTSCRETHPNWITVNRHEMNDLSGSRGEANFVWKCKNCKREASATMKNAPAAYAAASPARPKNVIEFDCRGCEFVEFKADGEWEATGIDSGTKFTAMDLSEGEWFDYDEKANEEFTPVNPRPMLQGLINEDVVVRLKWGQTEYKGQLVSVDSYMNIQLNNCVEYIDRKHTGDLGQVLIRCNNVLWISAAKGVEMNGGSVDAKMED